MRRLLLSLALALVPGWAAADQYAARYTPVMLQMQKTCVDFVLHKVNDGANLAQAGLAMTRQTKRKTIYEAKAGLRANFDTVYSIELGENNRGVRGCRIEVIRTEYDTARAVFDAALRDMAKKGGKSVGAPSGGDFSYQRFAFGATVIQVKSVFSANSLIMDYYIPR
ncbi:hypothetical protein [Rhodobacter lacus]|uniref:Uncharacterized protein n=1 Tax=Rhodobacter lacus TaxID=1641972 RepID=A0ABW5A4W5_9RHOB